MCISWTIKGLISLMQGITMKNGFVFYGPKQREMFHRNVCSRKLGFFIMTTSGIGKNRTIHVSDTSATDPRMIVLLLSISDSYSTYVNISQQVLEVYAWY